MVLLEPRKIEERYIRLHQQNKRLLMENEVLDFHNDYLDIDESWDFDLDPKYIKTKKINAEVWLRLNHIPEWLKHIEIDGSFNCSFCELNSLKNCPKKINGYFACSNNKLISLEDGPTYVGKTYWCNNNIAQFNDEYVRSICDVKYYIFVC